MLFQYKPYYNMVQSLYRLSVLFANTVRLSFKRNITSAISDKYLFLHKIFPFLNYQSSLFMNLNNT